jgi:lysyl-tRNA synthetase class 1
MPEKIIGHGTWYDKTAVKIVEREKKLGRSLDKIRTESGLGASGIPHIGSFSDCARSYAVTLALQEQGYNSEYIAFADDLDGLRKVPAGLPKSLGKYLGHPVTSIPDLDGCHDSFGEHITSLLLETLDESGINYTFMSAKKSYEQGLFTEQIKKILSNAQQVGEIVKEEVGQEKFVDVLPYFAVCANCGRIYTTKAHTFLADENKVLYTCEGLEIRGKWLEGCKHEGEADISKADGKLGWKVEFAARWNALDIRFEPFGKDISDSVRVNDRICNEVFDWAPPSHARYEMYLDKGGKKISKSAGNVFTPQVWFRYGSPQSLLLLTLKRFVGTRSLSVTDIPQYMNELDELEDVYFGKKQGLSKKEKAKLSGLYQYCWLLNPPSTSGEHVPYNLLSFLAKLAPEGSEVDYVLEKLQGYGYGKEGMSDDLKRRIGYGINWSKDFNEITEKTVELDDPQRAAVNSLIEALKTDLDEDAIQSAVFNVARESGVKPGKFFRVLYGILLGASHGPRLGPYVLAMGKENVVDALKRAVNG